MLPLEIKTLCLGSRIEDAFPAAVAVTTLGPTLYLIFPVIVIVILALFTF